MTESTGQVKITAEDVQVYAIGASLSLLAAALMSYWAETWSPLILWVIFTFEMAAILVAIHIIMNFIDRRAKE
jgi:hypothetical protein